MTKNRIIFDLQPSKTTEETVATLVEEMISVVQQLNAMRIPISIGPQDSLPDRDGLLVGQTIVDWSSGTSQIKTWDGNQFI